MKRSTWQKIALWLAAPAAAGLLSAAPANGIGGPVSGFVVDGRSHLLRPINGLPGSSVLGTPITLPFSAGLAAPAPGLDYAIVTDVHGTGEPFVAQGLASGAPAVTPLARGIAITAAFVAGSGTSAVLYSQPNALLQFVSGLPAQPQAGDPMDLSGLSGGLSALAVDSTGRTALLISGDGGIYRAGSDGQGPRFIVRAAGASSISLLPNGQDAVIGNRDTGEVLLIRGFDGAATVSTLAGDGAGIGSAIAVRALSDQAAGIVNAAGRFAIVDLDTSTVTWMELAGRADRIEPVDRNLFLLNHPGAGPLFLLDLTNGRTTYFIPPDDATTFETHRGKDIWKH
jgi:hypothetical protein